MCQNPNEHYLRTAKWAEINPAACLCKGSGWVLSDADTWHNCVLHGAGVPHPESHTYFNLIAHYAMQQEQAWETYLEIYQLFGGTREDFINEVLAYTAKRSHLTKRDFIDAAEVVCADLSRWVAAQDDEDSQARLSA